MIKKGIWIILLVLAAGCIYYFFNPSSSALFPKCPFLVATGLKCPGCGSQRAIHSLLHLNLAEAMKYNLLLVFSLPIVALLLYAELNRKKRPAFYAAVHRPQYIRTYFGIVICWWIARNIWNF